MILVSTIGRVFRYAGHSAEAEKSRSYCIVDKIHDGRNFANVKQSINVIFDIVEADLRFWCLPQGFQVCRT